MSRGEVSLLLTGSSPVILNKNEKFQFSIPQVKLLEHVIKSTRIYHKATSFKKGYYTTLKRAVARPLDVGTLCFRQKHLRIRFVLI